jgi:tetratricopeptide (TPR) repeat protein
VAQTIFRAWRANAILWAPLFTWDAITLLRGQPYPVRGWIAFGLTGLFIAYFLWVVLPGLAYKKMLEAGLWFRWEETRRWIRFLRGLKRFGVKPLVNLELDFRYAYSLAAEGRLNDALAMVKKYENHICGKYIYFARLAGLYEVAGDHTKMTESRRVAAQNGSGLAAEHLDIALGLLRRERNPSAAREVLSRFKADDCSELVKSYFKYCEGLLALEEGNWAKAETELNSAVKLAAPFSQHVLAKGLINEMKAFLGISVARLGRQDEAQALFQQTSPLLKARKEDLLLNRFQDALNARPSTRAQFTVCSDTDHAA